MSDKSAKNGARATSDDIAAAAKLARGEARRDDDPRGDDKRSDGKHSDGKRSDDKHGDGKRSDDKRGDDKRGDGKRDAAAARADGTGEIGFVAGARVYARMTMMRLRRGRLLWASLAMLLLPLVYVIPLALLGHYGNGFFDDVNDLYFLFAIPFLPALLLSRALADEIENKTFTFVFARPAPRASLIAGKYVASIAPLLAVLVPTLALVWLIALARYPADMADGWPHLLRVELAAVLGVCAYGALALALGAVFSRHPLIVVVVYVVLIEFGLGSSPVVANMLAVRWHLRNVAELSLPATPFMSLHAPAWVSALIAAAVTPLLLWLTALGISGAEYRTDR